MKLAKSLIVVLLLILNYQVVYAGTIVLGTVSADATVGGINDNFTTIANVVNGNISGSGATGSTVNVLADSMGELDMADEINPRLRDRELLGVSTDSTTVSNAFVYSGLTPADTANLTSDISAGTAYINGYRVARNATSRTYTASVDTYVDLSQSAVYAFSEVAVGATAPAVATNSARLARVTTDGTQITSVTDLANRRIPGLIIPAQYRSGLLVSRDSATTIRVFAGTAEINNTMVSKTAATTLTVSTAGDWAGGTSLQATSTYGYVGMDSSGNLRMHTTAPAFDNYGVTTTAGKLRYATWSSTVYRILGWFFMNATGSGELNTYEVGNIKEADVANTNVFTETNAFNTSSATFVADTNAVMRFYSSGGSLSIRYSLATSSAAGVTGAQVSVDTVGIPSFERSAYSGATTDFAEVTVPYLSRTLSQGTHTIQGYIRGHGGASVTNRAHTIIVEEI